VNLTRLLDPANLVPALLCLVLAVVLGVTALPTAEIPAGTRLMEKTAKGFETIGATRAAGPARLQERRAGAFRARLEDPAASLWIPEDTSLPKAGFPGGLLFGARYGRLDADQAPFRTKTSQVAYQVNEDGKIRTLTRIRSGIFMLPAILLLGISLLLLRRQLFKNLIFAAVGLFLFWYAVYAAGLYKTALTADRPLDAEIFHQISTKGTPPLWVPNPVQAMAARALLGSTVRVIADRPSAGATNGYYLGAGAPGGGWQAVASFAGDTLFERR
jgi:hypothetical protein